MLKYIDLLRKTPKINWKQRQQIILIDAFFIRTDLTSPKSYLMCGGFCFSTKKSLKDTKLKQSIESSVKIIQKLKTNQVTFKTIKTIQKNSIKSKKNTSAKQYTEKTIRKDKLTQKNVQNSIQNNKNQSFSLKNNFDINFQTKSKKESRQQNPKKDRSNKRDNQNLNKSQVTQTKKEINTQKKTTQKSIKQTFYKIMTEQTSQNGPKSLTDFLQNSHRQYINKKDNQLKSKSSQYLSKNKKSMFFESKDPRFVSQSKKSLKQQKKQDEQPNTVFEDLDELNELEDDLIQENPLKYLEKPQIQQMTTLSQILTQVKEQMDFPDQQHFEKNFFYVLNPKNNKEPLVSFGFRYFLFRFCKYHVYFSQILPPQELTSIELKAKDAIRYYCVREQGNGRKGLNKVKFPEPKLKYMQQFVTNLIGFELKFIFDLYIEIGIEYFKQLKQQLKQERTELDQKPYIPSKNALHMILTNIQRLIVEQDLQIEIGNLKEEDYARQRQLFTLFLDFYCVRKNQFETADKITCVYLAKFLKIQHPQFLQLIKETIQTEQQNYSTVEFLIMLGYLVESKNTPYEYFYKHKGTWMDIIESAHDFSDKKTKCCIKFLEILSRERFLHCQKIYFSLLQSIQNNIEAMEGKQLVRVLYFYSKARYGSDAGFLSNLVDKITRWLPFLQEVHFSLLVRSIGNLNYQSDELVEKLKEINYERFLVELKFGCENLGSYYKGILKEVEEQSKGRVYKDYFDGDEIILRPDMNVQETTAAEKVV